MAERGVGFAFGIFAIRALVLRGYCVKETMPLALYWPWLLVAGFGWVLFALSFFLPVSHWEDGPLGAGVMYGSEAMAFSLCFLSPLALCGATNFVMICTPILMGVRTTKWLYIAMVVSSILDLMLMLFLPLPLFRGVEIAYYLWAASFVLVTIGLGMKRRLFAPCVGMPRPCA